MLDKLDKYFALPETALRLRGLRQEVLASNIANADTPHYQARDFDFAAALAGVQQHKASLSMRTSDARHLLPKGQQAEGVELLYRNPMQPSIDGNTVDMDTERASFADNAIRYQATLTFLQRRIDSMKTALQN